MKKLILALCLVGGAMLFSSCSEDKCKDVKCENGGSCNEGKCECAAGYDGDRCGTISRERWLGTWAGTIVSRIDGLPEAQTMADTIIFEAAASPKMRIVGYTGDVTPTGNNLSISITEKNEFLEVSTPKADLVLSGDKITYTNAPFTGKLGGAEIKGTASGTFTKIR